LTALVLAAAFAVSPALADNSAKKEKSDKNDRERMKVVYRYFSGTGQIEGMCRPGEAIITVFCSDPNSYGTVIAPSAAGSQRPVGKCPPAGGKAHRMTLSCARL
jgi:hypothetical protein